jgi:hypothetical protein
VGQRQTGNSSAPASRFCSPHSGEQTGQPKGSSGPP